MPAAALQWMAIYEAHLADGVEIMSGGGVLTAAFGQRCQELDDAARALGGPALGSAAATATGRTLMAELATTSREFESLLHGGLERLASQRETATRSREGLNGYATTGQWLKATGGRYIERTG